MHARRGARGRPSGSRRRWGLGPGGGRRGLDPRLPLGRVAAAVVVVDVTVVSDLASVGVEVGCVDAAEGLCP